VGTQSFQSNGSRAYDNGVACSRVLTDFIVVTPFCSLIPRLECCMPFMATNFTWSAGCKRMQRVILLILVVIQLDGCSGGSSSSGSPATTASAASVSTNTPSPTPSQSSSTPLTISGAPAASVSAPPTISGTPAASVALGGTYNFTPVASDSNSKTLSFSIQNKPSWASFNSETGELSGTPTSADVGSYSNVSISVSDGVLSATLPSFSISVTQIATGSATLSWIPPTTNANGTTLTNLAGYYVHYGTNAASLADTITIANPGISTYVISNLSPGTWFFSVTAFNSSKVDSNFSNIVNKMIQ